MGGRIDHQLVSGYDLNPLTPGYNKSYTTNMKTAISIPDNVYKSAEELAKRLGTSRSQLYTKAISGYLANHYGENVTRALDAVYDKTDSRLDPALQNLQSLSLPKDTW